MIPWPETIGLLALLSLAWFWYDSFQARAVALAAAHATCRAEGLLLLDETVALTELRPVRDDDGHLCLRRVYQFEYSDTGDNRRVGRVALIGSELLLCTLEPGLRRHASSILGSAE